ncbi:BnaC04g55370D [Brassica napus]|uniref:Pectinesterase n=1 Tax=Brassica napus TaxID=3708 RepID=A0A078J6X2_BRANA|nr:BnaC04g55370D [Brassica napus]
MGTRRLFIALLCCFCLPHIIEAYHQQVYVDQSGHANLTKIQKAIDSVPVNNRYWFFINVAAGLYSLVTTYLMPYGENKDAYDKPFIVIVGAGKRNTRGLIVVWVRLCGCVKPSKQKKCQSTLLKALLCGTMTFFSSSRRRSRRRKRKERKKNSFNGDKCAFYSVGFSEVQDTLWDADGRHFFHRCTIQGAVDFIFGNGQSIYKVRYTLTIHITMNSHTGYITAPGRTNPYDASGFVFTDYLVHGTGKAFLGRPWCSYARVIFYNTDLSDVVVPQGWDSWHFGGHVSQLTFAEIGCYGSGSNTGRRVSWVKKLSGFCVQSMIRLAFINSGGWVQALPIPV